MKSFSSFMLQILFPPYQCCRIVVCSLLPSQQFPIAFLAVNGISIAFHIQGILAALMGMQGGNI